MSGRLALTRRALLAFLGSAAAWRPAIAAPERPRDVGIGGTGFAPEGSAGSDRGIGGTGFVGTIQRFGSIIVNDSRIAYAQDVPVTIDGLVRSARDLRIGHVVRVVARPDAGGLVTNTIAVEREVVGPVTAVYRDGFDVLGQAVQMRSGEPSKRWRKGEHVAVSGLRRLDGTIVASLVEPSAQQAMRVVGVVEQDDDGLWIGGLKLLDTDPALVGSRIAVSGRIARGGLRVDEAAPASPLPAGSAFSVESYVRGVEGRLLLGSGLAVRSEAFGYAVSPWRDVRAVLDGRIGPDGMPSIDNLRFALTNSEGAGNAGSPAGPQFAGPNGFGPGVFGGAPGGPGGPVNPGGAGPGGRGAPGGTGGPGGGPGGGGPGGDGPGR
ncbi:hypothetical protein [Bosea sp. ANAM02]|uniref:hypothetical protein n=1 Tax=Bosea sp. ANAM02 TaxID=2020412 RepID=UPI00140EB8A6|nr:hypothetical protein [Bosea sp. ANAM02]BCB20227.1 hypothetical protein OCUBac02_31210 [Bosea sp. ANAM02]